MSGPFVLSSAQVVGTTWTFLNPAFKCSGLEVARGGSRPDGRFFCLAGWRIIPLHARGFANED